jgi:hypothetical protein
MDKCHSVTLAIDSNINPFFTSVSQYIGFGTAEKLANLQSDKLTKAMVYFSVIWLDSFPSKGGISSHIMTRNIISK